MSDTVYCANCDTEAVRVVIHQEGEDNEWCTPLCATCAEAYGWGQADPEAVMIYMGEGEDEETIVLD